MKFTKFLAIALSLLMVFGMLASCGKTKNPQTTDPPVPPTVSPPKRPTLPHPNPSP